MGRSQTLEMTSPCALGQKLVTNRGWVPLASPTVQEKAPPSWPSINGAIFVPQNRPEKGENLALISRFRPAVTIHKQSDACAANRPLTFLSRSVSPSSSLAGEALPLSLGIARVGFFFGVFEASMHRSCLPFRSYTWKKLW